MQKTKTVKNLMDVRESYTLNNKSAVLFIILKNANLNINKKTRLNL